ncbi:MAG TPA: glycosyltransferase [Rhodopila sp.]|jgi:glycosyltransferase involved in cell wall biosynthesis|nr:glycosyltransferase [Rhodopila sp.]
MSITAAVSSPERAVNAAPIRAVGAPRPMSVAIYLHDLAGGGVERQSLIIAEEFRRSGIEVTMVLHRLRGQLLHEMPAGLRVVDLHSSRTLGDIWPLIRFLRRERPDVLLSNLDLNNVAALLAKAVSFSRTRTVICQHNPITASFGGGENWMYRAVPHAYRMLRPLISSAVAVSRGVADELCDVAGLPRDRVVTITNPVIGPEFHDRSQLPVSHPWFADEHRPVFVTAGRLVVQKDHETLLRAMALHRQVGAGRLIVLGCGPLEQPLRTLAQELGIADSVDFAGFQANALPYFRQADAFILSSRCEGFGNVLVEALGCGTPVISTRCEHGPAEILADGRYGVLVEPRNPTALAAAMNDAATLRERFPPEELRLRAADFSYAACAARYITMFKALAPHRAWVA